VTESVAPLLLGLALGIQHAADADHVVAVATIVSRTRRARAAVAIGALWALGHTLMLAAVGLAVLVLGARIAPGLQAWGEGAVALMLLALGALRLAWVFRGADPVPAGHAVEPHAHAAEPDDHGLGKPRQHALEPHRHGAEPRDHAVEPHEHGAEPHHHGAEPHPAQAHVHPHHEAFHSHPHVHEGRVHRHPHLHPSRRLLAAMDSVGPAQALRSVAVGLVHGLGGSAPVVLVGLATMPGPAGVLAYLGAFGAGTAVGMGAVTWLLSAPWVLGGVRLEPWRRLVAAASGALCLVVGLYLGVQVGTDPALWGSPRQP
jgi:high-affinity nickel-transport protein